jgi:hypothetical protein
MEAPRAKVIRRRTIPLIARRISMKARRRRNKEGIYKAVYGKEKEVQ